MELLFNLAILIPSIARWPILGYKIKHQCMWKKCNLLESGQIYKKSFTFTFLRQIFKMEGVWIRFLCQYLPTVVSLPNTPSPSLSFAAFCTSLPRPFSRTWLIIVSERIQLRGRLLREREIFIFPLHLRLTMSLLSVYSYAIRLWYWHGTSAHGA